MSVLNSRNATQRRRGNENPRNRPQKLISQEKSRLANAQYPAEKFLRLRAVIFARIHKPIESLANSSSAKRSSAARFQKNRRKNFSLREKPISWKGSSRSADAHSLRT